LHTLIFQWKILAHKTATFNTQQRCSTLKK
jgi:hypothetical protein